MSWKSAEGSSSEVKSESETKKRILLRWFDTLLCLGSGVNFLCFVLLFFISLWPYFMVAEVSDTAGVKNVRFGMSLRYASSASESGIAFCKECDEFVVGARLEWKDIISKYACSNETNIYEEWSGYYGFCNNVNGEYSQPVEITVMQVFMSFALIFSFIGIFAIGSHQYCWLIACAILGFSTCVSIIIILAMISTSEWIQDLLNPDKTGFLPYGAIRYNDTRPEIGLTAVPVHKALESLWTIQCLIFILVISFFTSLLLIFLARAKKREPMDKGKEANSRAEKDLKESQRLWEMNLY